MKLSDLIRRGARSLRSAKMRTFLTSMAIGVGAFALTLTFAATKGAYAYSQQIVADNFDPSELIVAKDFKIFGRDSSGFDQPQEYDDSVTAVNGFGSTAIKRLTEDDIERIAKTDSVEIVRPQYQLQPQFVTTDKTNAKKYVATINAYPTGQRPELRAGRAPVVGADLDQGQLLVPESYVGALGLGSAQQAIGQSVIIQLRRAVAISDQAVMQTLMSQGAAGLRKLQPFETKTYSFTIVGVTKRTATNFSASSVMYLSNQDARTLNDYATIGTSDYQKYITAFVRVKNGTNSDALAATQKKLSDMGYNVQSTKDTQQFITSIISTLEGIVLGFGAIAVIASVFGIINTQYISVLERTREIGLQEALGMSRRTVAALFTFEAAWIGLLGGAIGALVAVILGTLLNPWLTKVLELGEGNNILIFEPMTIVMLLAGLILVAMVAGLLPALKAARLDPIDALRSE